MYAVIFTARIDHLDDEYARVAKRMRDRAMGEYGCLEFVSVTQGDQELAVSYWSDLEQIGKWKNDPEHRSAQELGRSRWYKSYRVQVVEILRRYEKGE